MPGINTHILQEINKPEDILQGAIKSADNYTCNDADKLLESVTKKGSIDCLTEKQFISEADHSKTGNCV